MIAEKNKCRVCLGKKTVRSEKSVEVHIDRGMSTGDRVVVRGEGKHAVRIVILASVL